MFTEKEQKLIKLGTSIALATYPQARNYIDKVYTKNPVPYSKGLAHSGLKVSNLSSFFFPEAESILKMLSIMCYQDENNMNGDLVIPIIQKFFSNFSKVFKSLDNVESLTDLSGELEGLLSHSKYSIIYYMCITSGKEIKDPNPKGKLRKVIPDSALKPPSKPFIPDSYEARKSQELKEKWWKIKRSSLSIHTLLASDLFDLGSILKAGVTDTLEDFVQQVARRTEFQQLLYLSDGSLSLNLAAVHKYQEITRAEAFSIIDDFVRYGSKSQHNKDQYYLGFMFVLKTLSKEFQQANVSALEHLVQNNLNPQVKVIEKRVESPINVDLRAKLEEAQSKIASLEKENSLLLRDSYELSRLRTFLDLLEEEESDDSGEFSESSFFSSDFNMEKACAYLSGLRLYFIGGHYTLTDKLREQFPQMTVINMKTKTNISFGNIHNADAVILYRSHIPHKVSFRLYSTLSDSNVPVISIPLKTNIELITEDMYNKLKKLNIQPHLLEGLN